MFIDKIQKTGTAGCCICVSAKWADFTRFLCDRYGHFAG